MNLFQQFYQEILFPTFSFLGKIFNRIWELFKVLFLGKYIRSGVAILQTVWPLLLVLTVNYLFLNLMDQSQDLLDSLMQDFVYSFSAFACLLLYGLTVWYTTRIVFLLKDQSKLVEDQNKQDSVARPNAKSNELKEQYKIYEPIDELTLKKFTKWTPISLGVIPFLCLGAAFNKVDPTWYHWLSLVFLILLYIWIAYQVRDYVDNPQDDEQVINRYYYEDLRAIHKRTIWIGFIGGIILIILATCWQTNLFLSSKLGPLAVVFLALTLWAMIAGWLTYIDYRYRAPFTLVCFLLMIIFDNNNHQIRTLDNDSEMGIYSKYSVNRQTVPEHFGTWLDSLGKYRRRRGYIKNNEKDTIPIYLIATEGGGIRSAYWTAAVLRQLDSANNDFFRHVYAISGVSGGSVGAAFYTARYRDNLCSPQLQINLDAFFKHDHLSPLLTAMLIPDMLQKFSPVRINRVDRAQYLEDSWSSMYRGCDTVMKNEEPLRTFDQPFMRLWEGYKGKYRYQIPVLFLNSTQVETGRKGILTPLLIKNDPNFLNVIDIQDMVCRHIPLKTAASMSARFPLVTPPATVRVDNDPSRDAANFVDGGYIDNSGTTTLLSVLSSLTTNPKFIDSLSDANNCIFQFKLLLLKNSSDTDPNQSVKPVGGLYELAAPLKAFYESWDNGGGYRRYAVQEYLRGFSRFKLHSKDDSKSDNTKGETTKLETNLIDSVMYAFDLDRRTPRIPLGWELSEQAEDNICKQAQLQRAILNKKPYSRLFKDLRR